MKVSGLLLVFLVVAMACHGQKKNSAGYYFTQGESAYEDSKFTMALAHLNECLRMDPYFWDAYQVRAATRQALGDSKGALTDYNIYIESRPLDPQALIARATLRYELGQYLPAREDFLNLLKIPPAPTSKVIFRQTSEGTDKMFTIQGSNHADFLNYLGLIETQLKQYSKASAYLDSAVARAPHDPQYLINRGILKEHMRDTAGAVADYEQALSVDPSAGGALHNLAAIRRARGQQDESEALLDAAIMQSPSLAAPYAARAWFRYAHKNFTGAKEDYDKVISLDKTDEESWLYRGMVKEKLKDPDGAFVDYTESITLKSDYARAWLARGTLLARMNRLAEAVEDYTVAILWDAQFAIAFYNRALAREKLGRQKEACEDLIKAESFNAKVDSALKKKVCK